MAGTFGPPLEFFRAFAESAMPDECAITRPGTGGTLDPSTNVWTPNPPTVVYSGPCRVAQAGVAELASLFGGTEVVTQRFVGTLPHDVAEVQIGDRFAVTESADLQLVDRQFRVSVIGGGSWHVARRVGLEVTADG